MTEHQQTHEHTDTGPKWERVGDENGNFFHAFSDSPETDETREFITFITGDNGFGEDKGCVVLSGLKKQPDGSWGR